MTVSESDKAALHSKKLRELENKEICGYAFSAITTWGDLNDFKHYLPRIFELAAANKLMVNTFVILDKLYNFLNNNLTKSLDHESLFLFTRLH